MAKQGMVERRRRPRPPEKARKADLGGRRIEEVAAPVDEVDTLSEVVDDDAERVRPIADAVAEERVASGLGSPALAPLLPRAGVTMVLVRRDLRPEASDAPSPDRVDLALRRTPGLRSVASFGRSLFGAPPMLEVFEVEAGGPRDPRVEAVEMQIVTPEPGWRATIYAAPPGDVPKSIENGWKKVGGGTVSNDEKRFKLDTGGEQFRYYLVWITKLGPDAERAEISEIRLLQEVAT